MGIVIRPSPAVFRRLAPMVVVFGAFRRYEQDPPLAERECMLIRDVVAQARRHHAPLAFCRTVTPDAASEPGMWLPECRPNIRDRVFDHAPGSAFSNPEFSGVLNMITPREVYLAGPHGDSSMTATHMDILGRGRAASLILRNAMLQNCSAAALSESAPAAIPERAGTTAGISIEDWTSSLSICL